jgi:hypothetical protein
MRNLYNNFDEESLKLMLCTAYSMAQEKQNINEILNQDIFKYRDILDNTDNSNDITIIRNNLRKMELLFYKQSGYITNCKLLIGHIIHKINNPNASELPIFRYITKLDEC